MWLISETKVSFCKKNMNWLTKDPLIEAWLIYDLTYDVIWFRVGAKTEMDIDSYEFLFLMFYFGERVLIVLFLNLGTK